MREIKAGTTDVKMNGGGKVQDMGDVLNMHGVIDTVC